MCRLICCTIKYLYLNCGGSSLIDKKRGHSPNLEDLNTATPSVLSLNDMLNGCDKNPPFWNWSLYKFPSYTSSMFSSACFLLWKRCSRPLTNSGSVENSNYVYVTGMFNTKKLLENQIDKNQPWGTWKKFWSPMWHFNLNPQCAKKVNVESMVQS